MVSVHRSLKQTENVYTSTQVRVGDYCNGVNGVGNQWNEVNEHRHYGILTLRDVLAANLFAEHSLKDVNSILMQTECFNIRPV